MKKGILVLVMLLVGAGAGVPWLQSPAAAIGPVIGVNVLLNTDATPDILRDLGRSGTVLDSIDEIDVVHMRAAEDRLPEIAALPYVAAANPDAERKGAPVDTVAVSDFTGGASTWDQDAIDVVNPPSARTVAYDGQGVYVAVLDTGLLDSWRQYFPEQRIATEHAVAFSGGGADAGRVSIAPNQWEHDQNSHGTHVTSSVLGYSLRGAPIGGAAPKAIVIPVKVLNQAGFGWSSVVAHGIVYVTDLKRSGALGSSPVVISMSLGGSRLDAVEQAAIDYAIGHGVLVVAAAGNEGDQGMSYPGAYPPVISVAASGWIGEWVGGRTWWRGNVPDPTNPADFYITDFSSREKAGQDLDVAAPGSWVVGPFQTQSGQTSYFFLGGTSMATPHVSGIVALMLQKNPALVQAGVEGLLESTAIALPAGCRTVARPSGPAQNICWGADATGAGLATAQNALAAIP
ncbi:MAG: S8 family serine peptidase [Acidobacteria bacterium]|nr:S8 family serine peptidase [Acidobacteriota bacterium]